MATILAIIVLTIVCAMLSGVIFVAWYLTFKGSGWFAFAAVPLTYFCWWLSAKVFNEARIFDNV
jgi:hypothetical protein